MEVVEKVIEYTRPNEFALYLFGDMHLGTIHCAETEIRKKKARNRSPILVRRLVTIHYSWKDRLPQKANTYYSILPSKGQLIRNGDRLARVRQGNARVARGGCCLDYWLVI